MTEEKDEVATTEEKTTEETAKTKPTEGNTPQQGAAKPAQKMTKDMNFSPESHPGWGAISDVDIAAAVGIQDMRGVMGDAEELKKRQHILDPSKYKKEYKKPNPGKMPNNQDPFPVDLKIEEFETHYPPTNVYQLTTHVHGQPAAEAVMNVGANTDKRLIKLENNMATLMRLFFRLGTRVAINCVYYGGQNPGFNDYKLAV